MSSEVYIRWEVRNLENIHRQLKIQLEKEREHQAELFRQMAKDIGSVTEKSLLPKRQQPRSQLLRQLVPRESVMSKITIQMKLFQPVYQKD